MNYSMMSDEDIIRDIAGRVEKLRIEHQLKETDLEEAAGISRKTYYNFKQASTGISLRNFIRILRALDETDRLQLLFPDTDSYSPRQPEPQPQPKRVRDRQKPGREFKWGDES